MIDCHNQYYDQSIKPHQKYIPRHLTPSATPSTHICSQNSNKHQPVDLQLLKLRRQIAKKQIISMDDARTKTIEAESFGEWR